LSVQSEIERINNNVQSTLQTIAATGVEVGSNSDALPAAAAALANEKVSKAGDTMTGPLVLAADPTEDMQAATKKYVDDLVAQGGGESESRLPDGYTELVYIESTGAQHINTGFYHKYNTRIVMDVSGFTSTGFFFGAKNANIATASHQFALFRNSATTVRADYFGTNASATISDVTTRTTIDMNGNTASLYGKTATCTAVTSGESSFPMYLFSLNTAGSVVSGAPGRFKMYSCQIYDNGTMVRDYVPAMNADGVAGLYDLVNGAFYASATTTAFVAGPEMTGHAHTHAADGDDPITPAMIGAPTTAEMLAAIAAAGGLKIATGSYVGTGTFGSSNPKTLTFDFDPQFLVVMGQKRSGNTTSHTIMWAIKNTGWYAAGLYGNDYNSNSITSNHRAWGLSNFCTFSGKTVSWYNTYNAVSQLNYDAFTYHYLAVGT